MQPAEEGVQVQWVKKKNKKTKDQAQTFSSCIPATISGLYHSSLGTIFSHFSSTLTHSYQPVILTPYIKTFRSQNRPQGLFHLLVVPSSHSLFFSPHSSLRTNSLPCPTQQFQRPICYLSISLGVTLHPQWLKLFYLNNYGVLPKKRSSGEGGKGVSICAQSAVGLFQDEIEEAASVVKTKENSGQ